MATKEGRESALANGFLVLLAVLFLAIAFAVYHLFDYHVFWKAGRAILDGRTPYPKLASLAHDTKNYYVYPPLGALTFLPLAPLPFPLAGAFFSAALLAAALGGLRLLGVRDWRCFVAAFVWVATLQAVATGTLSALLVLLLALAWRYRDRTAASGPAVAYAVAAKLFVWPLLIWLVATRRLRTATAALGLTAAFVLLSWAAIGFTGFRGYPQLLRKLVDVEQHRAYSLVALVYSVGLGGAAAATVQIAACVGSVAVIGVLARMRDGDRRAFIAAVVLSLAVTPIVWLHYFCILLVPIALVAPRLEGLWLVPAILVLPDGDSHGSAWRILLGLGIAAFVAVATLRRSARAGPELGTSLPAVTPAAGAAGPG